MLFRTRNRGFDLSEDPKFPKFGFGRDREERSSGGASPGTYLPADSQVERLLPFLSRPTTLKDRPRTDDQSVTLSIHSVIFVLSGFFFFYYNEFVFVSVKRAERGAGETPE